MVEARDDARISWGELLERQSWTIHEDRSATQLNVPQPPISGVFTNSSPKKTNFAISMLLPLTSIQINQ